MKRFQDTFLKVADDAKIVLDYILEVFEVVYESLRRYQK